MAQELRRIEFRTEVRWVPEYLANLMAGIETYRYTFEEAVQKANEQMLAEQIRAAQAEVLKQYRT